MQIKAIIDGIRDCKTERKNNSHDLIIFPGNFMKYFYFILFLVILTPVFFCILCQWLKNGISMNVSEVIILTGMLSAFLLYMIIDIKGRHIILKNNILRQRFYYYKFVDINVTTIQKGCIKTGIDLKEQRGAITLRLQCPTEYMDINTFYYSMYDLRKLIKQIGLDSKVRLPKGL